MDLKVIPHKKVWLSFSALLVAVSIVVIGMFGLKQGIDFTGGTLLEIEFNQPVDAEGIKVAINKVETEPPLALASATEEVVEEVVETVETDVVEETTTETTEEVIPENAEPIDILTATADTDSSEGEETPATDENAEPEVLTEYSELNPEGIVELGAPVIQKTGDNSAIIRIKYINEDTHKQILERLKDVNGGEAVNEMRYENIGPVIGETLKQNAMISLVMAIIFIVLFISFAFRKMPRSVSSFKFGLTAVVALVHDVLIIVGLFAVLGHVLHVEIDTLFVTALLTVMGFSVHDTIVVFDRIRENMFRSKGKTFAEVANDSINQTLARSINTSVTTLITLFALFILGGASIKWFVFALIGGIIIGTYSSIFLATPILVLWHQKVSKD